VNDWLEWALDLLWGLVVAVVLVAWVALLAWLSTGCATTLPPPVPPLPPPMDIGQILPPAPGPLVVPRNVLRYKDIQVRRGQCRDLPPGVLVSPAEYAEQLDLLADRKRLRLELAATTRLRTEERKDALALEQAYQARFRQLEQVYQRKVWKLVVVAGGAALFMWGAVTLSAARRDAR
jgi:hypothetical protein